MAFSRSSSSLEASVSITTRAAGVSARARAQSSTICSPASAGVVDVQAPVVGVRRQRRGGVAGTKLRPRVALPPVVGAMDLRQLRRRDARGELAEQAARPDRGQLG
jgi:hypothetical protein